MNYNPETHVVVPFPELPSHIAKGNLGVCYYDAMQMHQYAMRYANLVIAAAPQPQQSVEPVVLTDEMYEAILQKANRTFLHYRNSIRGQMVTNLDNADFHIAAAAIKLFTAPPNIAEIQAKAILAAAELFNQPHKEYFGAESQDAIRELAEKVKSGEVKL